MSEGSGGKISFAETSIFSCICVVLVVCLSGWRFFHCGSLSFHTTAQPRPLVRKNETTPCTCRKGILGQDQKSLITELNYSAKAHIIKLCLLYVMDDSGVRKLDV